MKFTFKRISLMAAAVIAAFVVGLFVWYNVSLLPPNHHNTTAVSFEIPRGQKTSLIISRLHQDGLIRSRYAFLIYISLHGIRSQLQAGTYSLSPSKSAKDVAAIISQGKIASNLLVVPEGKNIAEITKLAEKKGIKPADFAAALSAKYNHSFLKGAPSLEGYLFPDSYQVDPQTSAKQLVAEMLDNFTAKVPAKYTPEFKRRGLTLREGLTLASIIEKEVNTASDRPKVAQVFLSRLKAGLALESDVTVDYAAAQLGVAFSTSIDSPYNTYRNPGLPPGPISNPGLSALDAVANPSNTNYLYFVTGRDGVTRFATTLQQHQQLIERYGLQPQ